MQVTFTLKNGETKELTLPLRMAEVLTKSTPYYLAYGQATVNFDTPDDGLNTALAGCMPNTADGGIKELSLLAVVVEKTDEEGIARIRASLPEEPCSVSDILQLARPTFDMDQLMERYTQELQRDTEKLRMTGEQLFSGVMERARENGDLARFEGICEYVLPEDRDQPKLCRYEFDMLPAVNFGGSEGVYIDCGLRGKFDESDRNALGIGTIKTLATDLEACKIMGELCGALLYHESAYVNEKLYLFDSAESIERMLTHPLALEQAQTEELRFGGQQL